MKLQIGIDGKNYEVDVEVLEEDGPPRPRGYLPPHAPPTTLRSQPVPSAAATGPEEGAQGAVDEAKVCRSPVAGVVIRIKAQPGQALEQDGLIMVLEAMKMETNVTASHPGTVKALKVAVGDGVKANQILMEYE